MAITRTSVDDVRAFWERNPLFVGETTHAPGSAAYFDEHTRVVIEDAFAGKLDPRTLPREDRRRKVLDLGCGPGFWTVQLCQAGCPDVTAADLTENALALARRRCALAGLSATFSRENAESLRFPDAMFSHVNCQGVIHHTPDTGACLREIARVLEPGGTASISVYFRGPLLRAWPVVRPLGCMLAVAGGGLKGRGRERIFRVADVNEIVRLYDGDKNPIGKAYSAAQLRALCEPYFRVDATYLHFFPARSLPFKVPAALHRYLDRVFGLMIYANLTKK